MWSGHWNLPEWCGPRFFSSALPAVKIVSCQPGPRPLVVYAMEISEGEAKYAHSFSSWTRPCWAKVKSVADIACNTELTETLADLFLPLRPPKESAKYVTRTSGLFVRTFEWSPTGLWLRGLPGSSEEASGSSQEVSMIIWVVSRITCLPGSSVGLLTEVGARSCGTERHRSLPYR